MESFEDNLAELIVEGQNVMEHSYESFSMLAKTRLKMQKESVKAMAHSVQSLKKNVEYGEKTGSTADADKINKAFGSAA